MGRPLFQSPSGASPLYLDGRPALSAAVSMDGRGRCLDNVFVERLWRSVNEERPHQSLDYRTPWRVN